MPRRTQNYTLLGWLESAFKFVGLFLGYVVWARRAIAYEPSTPLQTVQGVLLLLAALVATASVYDRVLSRCLCALVLAIVSTVGHWLLVAALFMDLSVRGFFLLVFAFCFLVAEALHLVELRAGRNYVVALKGAQRRVGALVLAGSLAAIYFIILVLGIVEWSALDVAFW